MSKKLVFEDEFLVSGMMCYTGCGNTISRIIHDTFDSLIKSQKIPSDSELILDASPVKPGINRIFISILSKDSISSVNIDKSTFKNAVKDVFDTPETLEEINHSSSKNKEWFNIFLGIGAISVLFLITIIFPPSILLTISLSLFSIVISTILAREHIIKAIKQLRNRIFANMEQTISLGWFLSLAHTVYHGIKMPLGSGLSMSMMSFMMPVGLLTMINIMDEIKRKIILNASQYDLKNTQQIFPELADEYIQGQTFDESLVITSLKHGLLRRHIKKDDIIKIKTGQCLPVDGYLLDAKCNLNTSLLTGETSQIKIKGDFLPAGSVNLGDDIWIIAAQNSYHSSINQLLFRANRAYKDNEEKKRRDYFLYIYFSLFLLALLASIITPLGFGVLTIGLALQSVMGILFAICPCTLSMAEELPTLLTNQQRQKNGIFIRNESCLARGRKIHTVVFDKTGTLTDGTSKVAHSEGLDANHWARLYLLEKCFGNQHPIAKSITNFYQSTYKEPLIQSIQESTQDTHARGISALVQGKHVSVGSIDFIKSLGVNVPKNDEDKIIKYQKQGFTVIHMAEDGHYIGFVTIRHHIREGLLDDIQRLKSQGIKVIMLTGDNLQTAEGFNRQCGEIFDKQDIHAQKSPKDKEDFLKNLMAESSNGVWFIGDGLNDAPSARMVSEKGGVSCAINSHDKVAYFTDLALNGRLNYLFSHAKLTNNNQKIKRENQFLMAYSIVAFTVVMIALLVCGISISPIIPLLMMSASTMMVVVNSFRAKQSVDIALNPSKNIINRLLASDASFMIGLMSLTCMIGALLMASIASGGLAIPVLAFGSGALMTAASSMMLLSVLGIITYSVMTGSSFLSQLSIFSMHKPLSYQNNHPKAQASPSRFEPMKKMPDCSRAPSEQAPLVQQQKQSNVEPHGENPSRHVKIG